MPERLRAGSSGTAARRPAGSPPHRLAGLDGARGLACLSVILAHVLAHFTPQVMSSSRLDLVLGHGVTFFFALSAFLLYLPYVERLASRRESPSTSTYLRHRAMRIFPAYLVIFMLANFVFRAVYLQNPFTVGWASGDEGTGMMTDPMQLLANLTLTQTLFPATLQTGINPSWTLTVEWGFYLVLPVIGVVLFARAGDSRHPLRAATIPAAILFGIGVATQAIVQVMQRIHYPNSVAEGYWGSNWTAVLSRSPLAFAAVFATGMLTAVAYVALSRGTLRSVSTLRLQWGLAAVVVLAAICALALMLANPHYVETAVGLASGAFILLIVIPFTRGQHSAIAAMMQWRPLRLFGLMTLSAYLWHFPVLLVVGRLPLPFPDNPIGTVSAFAVVTGATAVAAWTTYRLVEQPAMRLGK